MKLLRFATKESPGEWPESEAWNSKIWFITKLVPVIV